MAGGWPPLVVVRCLPSPLQHLCPLTPQFISRNPDVFQNDEQPVAAEADQDERSNSLRQGVTSRVHEQRQARGIHDRVYARSLVGNQPLQQPPRVSRSTGSYESPMQDLRVSVHMARVWVLYGISQPLATYLARGVIVVLDG